MKYDKLETNSSVDRKRYRKKTLSCSYCPPNQNENSKKRNKHFSKSWKVKSKRKKQFKESEILLG